MKKIFLLTACCMLAFCGSAYAQGTLKNEVKFHKNDTTIYTTHNSITAMGQNIEMNNKMLFVVKDADADGYIIEQSYEMDAPASDNTDLSSAAFMFYNLLRDQKLQLRLDKDGVVKNVLNHDELLATSKKLCQEMYDKMLKEQPEIGAVITKEKFSAMVEDQMTEENIIKSLQEYYCIFMFNGKPLVNGANEQYTDLQGIKLNRFYFVASKSPLKVKVTESSAMTKDEWKALILKQVKDMFPDQADMIESQIDSVLDSGMIKTELKSSKEVEYFPNGWEKSFKSTSQQSLMGQETTVETTVECTYHNW